MFKKIPLGNQNLLYILINIMFVCFVYLVFMPTCKREKGRHDLSTDLKEGGSAAEKG